MLYRLQVSQSSLTESQRTASELGQKLQEIQLARSSAEQVNHHDLTLIWPNNVLISTVWYQDSLISHSHSTLGSSY